MNRDNALRTLLVLFGLTFVAEFGDFGTNEAFG
jgi:hypothetical protein